MTPVFICQFYNAIVIIVISYILLLGDFVYKIEEGGHAMNTVLFDFLHEDAKNIRVSVFMDEQGFKDEFDEIDQNAFHLVGYHENHPVATCRFFKKDEKYYIGRVAVLKEYRKHHYGAMMIHKAEEYISSYANCSYLSAQVRVKGFYEKLGYKMTGDVYDDEGVPHILMYKKLKK
jgi:predicted GNAT family N-acyltransferase